MVGRRREVRAMRRRDPYVRAAASCLCTRTSIVAVGVLLLNDHVLKAAVPSWLTGKLSDFAGLYFAPYLVLLVVFGSILAAQSVRSWGAGGRRVISSELADALAASVFLAVAALFAALKLAPSTSDEALVLLRVTTGY